MRYFEDILEIINQWSQLGIKEYPCGKGIGHAPHIAPQAYLVKVYDPLTNVQIEQMENELRRKIPDTLANFYKQSNGLQLFHCISIHGLIIEGCLQPISIRYQNIYERPANTPDDAFFFGTYNWDGSHLYVLGNKPSVYLCAHNDASKVECVWPSFEEFIVSEVKRLACLHDGHGRIVDPEKPTVPYSAPSEY